MDQDHEYWQNLEYPKKPNPTEVELFTDYSFGSVLLLGETKALQPHCTEAVDIFPSGFAKQGDWFSLDKHYNTIIGDGVINITGMDLVDALRSKCDRLIIRVFGPELEHKYLWKYAKYFPDTFPGALEVFETQPGCRFVIWDFTRP
jgi:hypothetical protein